MMSPGMLAGGGMFENKLNEYGSNDMLSDQPPGGAFSKMVSDFGDNKISEVVRQDSNNNVPESGISEQRKLLNQE